VDQANRAARPGHRCMFGSSLILLIFSALRRYTVSDLYARSSCVCPEDVPQSGKQNTATE